MTPLPIQLLLSEAWLPDNKSRDRRKLKGMLKELRDQAEVSIGQEIAARRNPRPGDSFRVVLDGGLDVFQARGACQALTCRLGYVDQIARTFALLADELWLQNFFTERFISFGRSTNKKLDLMLDDVYLLTRLKPLINANIVRFQTPFFLACATHKQEFDTRLDSVVTKLVNEYSNEFRIEQRSDGTFSIFTGRLYEPEVILYGKPLKPAAAPPNLKDYAAEEIYEAIRSVMWAARDAAIMGGAVFSNSPIGLAALLQLEGKSVGRKEVELFQTAPAGAIPWIDNLTIEQTLQVRREAEKALPALRAFLAKHLTARPIRRDTDTRTERDYIFELKEQAAQVRAELESIQRRAPASMRNAIGILSLVVLGYGYATNTISHAAGLFQLLTTLGLLHELGDKGEHKKTVLQSKPGYVLVKAQDILRHSHQ